MKPVYTLILLVLFSPFIYSQTRPRQHNPPRAPADTIVPGKGAPEKQLKEIKKEKITAHSDSAATQPPKSNLIDTTIYNKYGDLLNDDTSFNRRYPVAMTLVQVAGANAVVWTIDRYMLHADFSRIGFASWKYNIKTGWEWDTDRFGINFIGHPYSGTLSFNAGRSRGYNYFQSASFAVAGSLMWEYFGETTRPSYNDIINTPVNGAFLGEILYRLSSNILDDRTRGFQRFSRELLAGLIDPMRGINRLMQGKTFRRTNKEVYQKEPLNISLYAGFHKINDAAHHTFGRGPNNTMASIQIDYGNPFETRFRKPFDFFKLRTEFSFGVGRKILGNVLGYGILAGKNSSYGNQSLLLGIFQYYDYWDNKTFELGAVGFGGGVFHRLPVGRKSGLYTNVHIALIPFAGNSTLFGPDSSQTRDYDFGGGLEGKIETTFNLGEFATASLVYYYYFIHTYLGLPGNNSIGILKPRISVRLYKSLSIGAEHYVYYNRRSPKDYPALVTARTEQKIFLLLYLEDKQRRGKYN